MKRVSRTTVIAALFLVRAEAQRSQQHAPSNIQGCPKGPATLAIDPPIAPPPLPCS